MLVLVLALAAPWTNVPGDNADGAGMQAHLHGLFESRELLYDDEYRRLGMTPLFAFVTEQGLVSNHWPIGASFLQVPGWLLGRAAGELLVGEGISERAGESAIPLLGVRAWAIVVCVGLLFGVYGWLRARTSGATAMLSSIALLVGTPLLYYATEAAIRPHLWGTVVVAIVIARWWDAVEGASRTRWTGIELAGWVGLATAIRPQLAVFVLLVAHERWLAHVGLEQGARVRAWLRDGAIAAAAFLPWAVINPILHRWMYGELGDYAGDVTMHVRSFLLSTHHGAFVWCPVLVLGVLGLAIGLARRRPGAGLLLGILAVQVWLDSGTREIEPFTVLGTRTWTGGTSFGPRKLLDVAPMFLPAVIWIHGWLGELELGERRKWVRRLVIPTVASVIPTGLLHVGAWLDPNVTAEVMDGERLLIAMGLAFDPSAWSDAFSARDLPVRVAGIVSVIVTLPLALAVGFGLRSRELPGWVVPALGVVALAWLAILIGRTQELVAAEPERIEAARAEMDPVHRVMVGMIPRHHSVMRERIGDEAVD